MNQETIEEIARQMITAWACSDINHGVRAKPLPAALYQFTTDAGNAEFLKAYDHPFGWIVEIFDEGVMIHRAEGRVASAEALLDVFIVEARSAIHTFGADKFGSFAPIK